MTIEEYEEKFVTDWLQAYQTAPTIADALEWQRKQDAEKTCEWIMRTPMYAKQPTQLVDEFRKAMEE